ncbi:MAG: ABC-type transporter Mla subunit MlaD [Cyclobacteriaceae bacterium]|jgi:ABC-type transporter Mla subunit MlaD
MDQLKTSAFAPFEVASKDRIVGLFVIGAVLLILMGYMIPAIQKLSADEGLTFHTELDQTYGIAPEANVSLRGVVIGHVARVAITPAGMVRVDMSLSKEYADFYTQDSRLAVDTNIGVNTILTGSGLILTPGAPDTAALGSDAYIPTDIPQGIAALLEELDLAELTRQITDIVTNVQAITAGINDNQEKIYRSLDNLEIVTQSLAQVSESFPGMVQSVDKSLGTLDVTLTGVDQVIRTTDTNLQATLQNITLLTTQATATLAETSELMRATSPVMEQLPTVLLTTDVALQSITRLTDQVSQSWLLGGSSQSPEPQPVLSAHPHDDAAYDLLPSSGATYQSPAPPLIIDPGVTGEP